jgi:hypothetical protein
MGKRTRGPEHQKHCENAVEKSQIKKRLIVICYWWGEGKGLFE